MNNFRAVTPQLQSASSLRESKVTVLHFKQTLTRQENSVGYDTELLPTIHLALQVV